MPKNAKDFKINGANYECNNYENLLLIIMNIIEFLILKG